MIFLNNKRDKLIAKLLFMLFGAGSGIFIMLTLIETNSSHGIRFIFGMAGGILLLVISMFLQTVIHELGHLVFGLLSGYGFVSFRIGNIMLIKERGRLKIKLFTMVGTGGQCILTPPDWSENLPYKLYNIGGCIMNSVFALVGLAIVLFAPLWSAFWLFGALFALAGINTALTNGIPLRVGGVANDGYNAFSLGGNRNALRAFWLSLYVNGLLSEGESYRNMPKEWFELPEGDDLNNPIICTVGVLCYNYLFDTHNFAEAERTIDYMLKAPGLLEVHRNELLCELVFLRILRGAEKNEIDSLITPGLDRYIKATANYISRRRLAFAYQYLYKKNYDMAEKCLRVFEQTAKTYPYSAEIENEREIIEIIKNTETENCSPS